MPGQQPPTAGTGYSGYRRRGAGAEALAMRRMARATSLRLGHDWATGVATGEVGDVGAISRTVAVPAPGRMATQKAAPR